MWFKKFFFQITKYSTKKYENFERKIKIEWALVQEILIFENLKIGYYVAKQVPRDCCIANGVSVGTVNHPEIFLKMTIIES